MREFVSYMPLLLLVLVAVIAVAPQGVMTGAYTAAIGAVGSTVDRIGLPVLIGAGVVLVAFVAWRRLR